MTRGRKRKQASKEGRKGMKKKGLLSHNERV
jgi:hypothetical protein